VFAAPGPDGRERYRVNRLDEPSVERPEEDE